MSRVRMRIGDFAKIPWPLNAVSPRAKITDWIWERKMNVSRGCDNRCAHAAHYHPRTELQSPLCAIAVAEKFVKSLGQSEILSPNPPPCSASPPDPVRRGGDRERNDFCSAPNVTHPKRDPCRRMPGDHFAPKELTAGGHQRRHSTFPSGAGLSHMESPSSPVRRSPQGGDGLGGR